MRKRITYKLFKTYRILCCDRCPCTSWRRSRRLRRTARSRSWGTRRWWRSSDLRWRSCERRRPSGPQPRFSRPSGWLSSGRPWCRPGCEARTGSRALPRPRSSRWWIQNLCRKNEKRIIEKPANDIRDRAALPTDTLRKFLWLRQHAYLLIWEGYLVEPLHWLPNLT